jgi:hypothetical protein
MLRCCSHQPGAGATTHPGAVDIGVHSRHSWSVATFQIWRWSASAGLSGMAGYRAITTGGSDKSSVSCGLLTIERRADARDPPVAASIYSRLSNGPRRSSGTLLRAG